MRRNHWIIAGAACIGLGFATMQDANSQQPCPPVLCIDECPAGTVPLACSVTSGNEYEGFGAVTQGGEGGETCRVTTLADSGAGSFRDCLVNRNTQSGAFTPRIVVFDVGGTIQLQSDVRITTPFMTIDGSTAPNPGITITKATSENGEVRVTTSNTSSAHDLIFTHLRFDGGGHGKSRTGLLRVEEDHQFVVTV